MIKLSNIIDVENDIQIFSAVSPLNSDISLWSLIRFSYHRLLVQKIFDNTFVSSSRSIGVIDKAQKIAVGFSHSMSNSDTYIKYGPKDVVISTSGGRYQTIEDKTFNILSDYFYNAEKSSSAILEDFALGTKLHDRLPQVVYSNNPFYITANIGSRFNQKVSIKKIREFLYYLIDITENRLNLIFSSQEQQWLERLLVKSCFEVEIYLRLYGTFLRKLKPKFLLAQCASYGGSQTVGMLLAAKAQGIKTGEFQHGIISKGTESYNYPSVINNSIIFKNTIPDYILLYGKFWNRGANTPSQRILIGCPNRTESIRKTSHEQWEKIWVTVLGNGYDTAEYIQSCKIMSKQNPDWQVNFRPHPIERTYAKSIVQSSDINVDLDLDIYRTFKKSRVLIGEVSNSLYEAIGLVDHIFSINSDRSCFFDPDSPFVKIDNLAEFCENEFLIKIDESDSSHINENFYWEEGWITKYRNFIHELN